jgi:hypothetical protein
MMVKNVGGVEQKIRLLVGLLAIGIAAFAGLPMWGAVLMAVVGIIAIVTGMMGHCPLWSLFGINTCPFKKT